MANKTITKIKISFTIEIDVDIYRDHFDEPKASISDIRDYVISAAESAARSELENLIYRRGR